MEAKEALRAIMDVTGTSFSELMGKIGIKSNTLANRLNQENISVKKLDETARVMDYKIVLVPRDVKLGKDWFKVE